MRGNVFPWTRESVKSRYRFRCDDIYLAGLSASVSAVVSVLYYSLLVFGKETIADTVAATATTAETAETLN